MRERRRQKGKKRKGVILGLTEVMTACGKGRLTKKPRTVLRNRRGFEQRVWQERLEIDHKDQVPQGELTAV